MIQFYQTRERLTQLWTAAKQGEGGIPGVQNGARVQMNRIANKLSPLWKMLRKAKNIKLRTEIYRAIEILIKQAPMKVNTDKPKKSKKPKKSA